MEEAFIERIKQANPILEIAGEYGIDLKKSGKTWKGLCPFHEEKTPSFTVYPNEEKFYCSGCHAKGDIFDIIQEKEKTDFNGAIQILARRAGLEIPKKENLQRGRKLISEKQETKEFLLKFVPQLLEKGYREAKLAEILAKVEERIEEARTKGLTAPELLEKVYPPGRFLIGRGLIPKEGYVLLGAYAKEGKTTLALDLSLHYATETDFLNFFPIEKTGKVLYLFAENTEQGLQDILQKQVRGFKESGIKVTKEQLNRIILLETKGLFLDSLEGILTLQGVIDKYKVSLVVIDPLSLFIIKDINKLDIVRGIWENLNRVSKEQNCSFLLIHHYRKPAKEKSEPLHEVLGSSGLGNFCNSFMGLEKAHGRRSAHYKRIHFVIRQDKPLDPINIKRNPEYLTFETIPEGESLEGVTPTNVVDILKELGGKAAYTLVVDLGKDRFGVTKQRIGEALTEARVKGLIDKEPGRYGKYFPKQR